MFNFRVGREGRVRGHKPHISATGTPLESDIQDATGVALKPFIPTKMRRNIQDGVGSIFKVHRLGVELIVSRYYTSILTTKVPFLENKILFKWFSGEVRVCKQSPFGKKRSVVKFSGGLTE